MPQNTGSPKTDTLVYAGSTGARTKWGGEDTHQSRGVASCFTAEFGHGRQPESLPDENVPLHGEALRLLVAEDNSVNQLVIPRLLQKLGDSVMLAANGDEAVRVFEREAPDAILMDVQMPLMDGFEATAAIRERETVSGHRIPIFAVTAHAFDGYRKKCLDAGMDDYITKPIDPDDLARVLAGVPARCVAAQ